ncbi:MAG: PqqD family protein [Puniceicoccaceae bacterium]|nr:MAG: PqqD family protein [Puniceicoccaceae bacterium]
MATAETSIPGPHHHPPWLPLMRCRLLANKAVSVETDEPMGLRVSVPVQPRAWARPPLTWILPLRERRRFALDPIGKAIWQACRTEQSVATVVREFGRRHRLSFHEARVALTPYLQQLVERGILVLVGPSSAHA